MCSGTLPNPRNWNRELHDIAGCDHDSPTARRLDSFLNDFVMFRHYNRPAEPVETHPLKFFDVTRRMREDAAKEPRGETITFGPASSINFPVGCHKPDFLGHEQPDPKVDLDAVKQFIGGICAEVVPCTFKFFTRPGYCTGFWVRQHGRQIEHFENESDAKAKCDFLNRVPDEQVPQADAAAARRIITEDLKTAADCFAKGGYLTGQPQTTFGGIPVAPPIDLPPPQVKPRVRGLASLRRSWRVR